MNKFEIGMKEHQQDTCPHGWALTTTICTICKTKYERDMLLEALKNILPFVATQAIGCHGHKCREQWCWSCYGEEDAEEAASQALVLAKEASRIIKEIEGQNDTTT